MVYLLSFASMGVMALVIWQQHEFILEQQRAYRAVIEALAHREGVKVAPTPTRAVKNPYSYVDPNPSPGQVWPDAS